MSAPRPLTLALLASAALLPEAAHAFSTRVHMAFANELLAALEDGHPRGIPLKGSTEDVYLSASDAEARSGMVARHARASVRARASGVRSGRRSSLVIWRNMASDASRFRSPLAGR